MDGILVDLLNAKWNTFVKFRFYRQFFLFCFYFVLSLVSFTLRPGPATTSSVPNPVTQTPPLIEFSTISPKVDPPISNVTIDRSLNAFQHDSNLSLLLHKIVVSTASVKYPWNVTRTRLDKLKLEIIENLTTALNNVLSTDRNEIEFFNHSYKTTEYFHSTSNDTTPIDNLKITINETVLSVNSTILFDDGGISFASGKYNWYVAIFEINNQFLDKSD